MTFDVAKPSCFIPSPPSFYLQSIPLVSLALTKNSKKIRSGSSGKICGENYFLHNKTKKIQLVCILSFPRSFIWRKNGKFNRKCLCLKFRLVERIRDKSWQMSHLIHGFCDLDTHTQPALCPHALIVQTSI